MVIVAPAPIGETRIGGIVNFIRGFVRHMPDDFEAEIVGVAVGNEARTGEWRTLDFAERRVRFLPVVRSRTARRSGWIPIKMRIVAGMIRHRNKIQSAGRVVQTHAPAMDLGIAGRCAPIIRVVHSP